MPNILLLNDGRNQNHFGTHFVMDVMAAAFKPARTVVQGAKPSPSDFEGMDFVVVNAEGSTHRNRKSYLYKNYGLPSVMINAVWQDNDPVDLGHFSYISTRERMSAQAMKDCGVEANVVPDVMLLKELTYGSGGGQVVSDSVKGRFGTRPKREYLKQFLDADQLVCGRFHVACLALVTNKPFSAYPSNTWKTEGMMKDAGLSEFYSARFVQAVRVCPDEPAPEAAEYLLEARARIKEMLVTVQRLAGLRA